MLDYEPRGLSELLTADPIRPMRRSVPKNLPKSEYDREITQSRIEQAMYDSQRFDLDSCGVNPDLRIGSGMFAFGFHPRNIAEKRLKKDDVGRQFPFLTLKYLPRDVIRAKFREIPPFRASLITGLTAPDGRPVSGWNIVSTIIPDELNTLEGIRSAQQNIIRAAKLAYYLGCDGYGLGAMESMLTHHGKLIRKEVPGLHVTTGHTTTSYLVNETLAAVSTELGLPLNEMTVAFNGAAGSIAGTAARSNVDTVGKAILVDVELKRGELEQFRAEHPSANIEIVSVNSNNDLRFNAMREADVVISATTQAYPYIEAHNLKPGVIVIDDSAPESIAEGVAESVGGIRLDVVGNTPNGLEWNFKFGLYPGSSFGCGAEIATLAALESFDLGHTGRVTPESYDRLSRMVAKVGFTIGPFQSHGKLKTSLDFSRARQARYAAVLAA